MQSIHAAETKPTNPRLGYLYLSLGSKVPSFANAPLWCRNKVEWTGQAAQVLGIAQQQEQNCKTPPSKQSDLLDCRVGFPYPVLLLAPQAFTRRLPARSSVQDPPPQALPTQHLTHKLLSYLLPLGWGHSCFPAAGVKLLPAVMQVTSSLCPVSLWDWSLPLFAEKSLPMSLGGS